MENGMPMSKALITAIDANDPDAVRKALEGIKDINRKLPGADKPLLYAAKIGADKVLPTLFEAGAIAEKRHTFPGDTPFAIAAKHHQGKVLAQLLALHQASEFATDHALTNAMMENDPGALDIVLKALKPELTLGHYRIAASQHKAVDLVKVLLQNGGSPAARFDSNNSKNITVFHEIVRYGKPDLIKLLLDHGAGVNARDGSGGTPLMTLAAKLETFDSHNEQAQFRLDAIAKGIAKSDVHGPPKVLAPLEVIELLRQAGADATLRDDDGNDALDNYRFSIFFAYRKEPVPAIIDRLVRAGAKGSQSTLDLFKALKEKNPDAIRKAIANGADINRLTPPRERCTPLILAVRGSSNDPFLYINLLLEAGADPNKSDGKYTPLIYAARSGNLEVVKALISAGADVHRVCVDGEIIENAYSAAEDKDAVREYLKSLGAKNPQAPNAGGLKPGVASWNDFSELLVKTTVPKAADALARMINGKVTPEVYEKSVTPGKNAFVILRPKNMNWCNILQVAPPLLRFSDSKKQEKFAVQLAAAAGAPVLFIEYSDTADAVSIFQAGPDGKSTKDAGWDNDLLDEMVGAMGDEAPGWAKQQLAAADEDDLDSTERLQQLAGREKFAAAALGLGHKPGQKLDIEFPGLGPKDFDGVAFVSD